MLQLASPAHRADVNRLAAQIHNLHVSWRPDLFEHCVERYSEERFLNEIKNRNLYVAVMEGQVIGYALLNIRLRQGDGLVRSRILEVVEFCVEEMLRGHGIGKAMMADIRALARAFRCDSLRLSVYPQNDDAVAFYQKCGFTIHTIGMECKL